MTDKVFVSGPMFSVADKAQQVSIAHVLEDAGFSTVVPHRDGIEVAPVMDLLNDPGVGALMDGPTVDRCIAWVTRAIACLDIYWATTCQCTVLNIDGRVPDEGALVEATAAWMSGRPVVVYQTSPIRMLGKNNSPMIGVVSAWTPSVSALSDLPVAVTVALSAAAPIQAHAADQIVGAGRCIAALRAWPLSSIPLALLEVLEPNPTLHEMCRFVLRTIVEFSEADDPDVRTKILLEGIDGLKEWTDRSEVSHALCTALPC